MQRISEYAKSHGNLPSRTPTYRRVLGHYARSADAIVDVWNANLEQAVEDGNALRNYPIDCYWPGGSRDCICLRRLGDLLRPNCALVTLALPV
jgi:hypothetical protein